MKYIKEINNLNEEEAKDMLLRIIENSYTLVNWPDSQDYMEEKWFREEAVLDNSENAESSSYLIPTKYVL